MDHLSLAWLLAPIATTLIAGLKARMQAVTDRCAGLPKPRVASIEWIDPLMAAGNWMPELVEMAGGTNLFGEAGKHARSAVACPTLPLGVAVEVDGVFEIG